MARAFIVLLSVFLVSAFLSTVTAHVPLDPVGNESLTDAYSISDSTKSWVLYGELREGFPQYYQFDVKTDQRIFLGLIIPYFEGSKDFNPGFILMGPGLLEESVPSSIDVPPDYGTLLVEGQRPTEATFEPFSPGTFYLLGELDLTAPSAGTYYVAVFSAQQGGNYGLVIGYREAFTLTEWILTPLSLLSVYTWEGQIALVALSPMLIVVALGVIGIAWRRKVAGHPGTIGTWAGALAGLLFIGSGGMISFQLALALTQSRLSPDVSITVILALIPILLGYAILRVSLKGDGGLDRRRRIVLAVLGIAGLFAWAGLFLGPALAVGASVLPAPRVAQPSGRAEKASE